MFTDKLFADISAVATFYVRDRTDRRRVLIIGCRRRVSGRGASALGINSNDLSASASAYPAVFCDGCGSPTRLVSVFPLLSAPGTDEITGRCEPCGTEHTRRVSSEAGDDARAVEYRIYYSVGRDGHFSGAQIIECFDDDEAIRKAQQAAEGGRIIELWERSRLIKQFLANPAD
jgi:hypothetical protein